MVHLRISFPCLYCPQPLHIHILCILLLFLLNFGEFVKIGQFYFVLAEHYGKLNIFWIFLRNFLISKLLNIHLCTLGQKVISEIICTIQMRYFTFCLICLPTVEILFVNYWAFTIPWRFILEVIPVLCCQIILGHMI